MITAGGGRRLGEIAGIILAGGRNSRFPIKKGFIRIGGIAIIERNLCLMRSLFRHVMISTNMPELYFYLGAPLVGDVLPSRGPLSGIYSALINSHDPAVFVVACDMPFVETGVISLICGKYEERTVKERFDAVIPVFGDEPQPLFGVYCKTALHALEDGIMNDKVSIKLFLREIRTLYVDETDVRAADPKGSSFVNINTMNDYEMITGNKGMRGLPRMTDAAVPESKN
ncbi:MAG: molybdenum cofactor guanylyltransferase [Dissulfurispiraceae bacterium]